MIRVSKIAHASYETPDLDQQIEYYTDIIGLTVAAKEKDKAYLASTVDHHSVVLERGPKAHACVSASRSQPTPISASSRSRSPRTASRQRERRIRSPRSPTW